MMKWQQLAAEKRPLVMGILNATPDSFSGDGLIGDQDVVQQALAQAKIFIEKGADILDIGGESTRPGADYVHADEEIARVVPVITAIREAGLNTPISIDTYKATVARAALDAGADFINDVWGGQADDGMLPLAQEKGCGIMLMHNRSKPGNADIHAKLGGMYHAPDYQNFLPDVISEMKALAQSALDAGINAEDIILDPGVGFGKTVEQNMALIQHLDRIKRETGFPMLLGTSRKSFIGKVLDVTPQERVEGTAATVAVGVMKGADILRVHDVEHMSRVVRMTHAIAQS